MAKLYDISDETIKLSDAAANLSYNVPDSAAYDPKSRTHRWLENLTITSCTSQDSKLNDGTDVVKFQVKGKLTHEGANGGKPFTGTFQIDYDALKKRIEGDKKLTMSLISVNRLRTFAAALSYEVGGEGMPATLLNELFPDAATGETSPAVNQRIGIKIAQSPRNKNAKEGDPDFALKSVNVDGFLPAGE